LATRADRDGTDFVITGRKWLITGADGAGMCIVMARAFDGDQELGPTMFLAPMPDPAIEIVRQLDTMDGSFTGGHAELQFNGLRVPSSAVLGELGQGLRYAQVRLAPARLTHCMRWLGAAVRAHGIAIDHARRREAFGRVLAEHGGTGVLLADSEIDLHVARLAIHHAAWLLDQGRAGRHESSMVKVFVSEALFRIADRCVQVLGGLGLTRDTEVERIFREMRAFRIYDGPTEVHRWAITRRIVSGRA
jgi:acyl-CoA dehydrogenase